MHSKYSRMGLARARARTRRRGEESLGRLSPLSGTQDLSVPLKRGLPKTNTSTLVERRVQVGRHAHRFRFVPTYASSLSLFFFVPRSVSLIVFNGIDKLYDKSLVSQRYRSASVVNSSLEPVAGLSIPTGRHSRRYGGNTCEPRG
jgi:hypothetical protein